MLALLTLLLAVQDTTAPAPDSVAARLDSLHRVRLVLEARHSDSLAVADSSALRARDRATRWRMVLLLDSTDAEAIAGYEQARAALVRAIPVEAGDTAAQAEARADRQRRLGEARQAFAAGRLREAELLAREVLLGDSLDAGARSLVAAVEQQRTASGRGQVQRVGGLALGGVALLTVLAAAAAHRARRRQRLSRMGLLQVLAGPEAGRALPLSPELEGLRLDALLPSFGTGAVLARAGERLVLFNAGPGPLLVNGRPLAPGAEQALTGGEVLEAGAARVLFAWT